MAGYLPLFPRSFYTDHANDTPMKRIAILSSSVRSGRLSHRVALYLERYLERSGLAAAEVLDLKRYDFPLFDERFAFQTHPSRRLFDFTRRLFSADGIIVVTPVYNADFPASLKNAIDLYYEEWVGKPVAVVSVTSGQVPGIATVQKLQTLLLKLEARVVPGLCTVISVGENFDEQGVPRSAEQMDALVRPMVEGLLQAADCACVPA